MPTLEERMAKLRADLDKATPPSVQGNQTMVDRRKAMVPDSTPAAIGHAFSNRILSNAANVPDVAANLGARAINHGASSFIPDALKPSSYQREGGDVRNAMMPENKPLIPVPPIGQDFVPGPSGSDLMGLVQRVGEGAAALKTGDFNQFRPDASGQQQARTEAFAEQNPGATMVGNLTGDIVTMLTARGPMARNRGQANFDLAGKMDALGAPSRLAKAVGRQSLAPSVRHTLGVTLQDSAPFRAFMVNRFGRAAESGMEGFILSAINGESDPVETAGFAAGTQLGASVLTGSMGGLINKAVKDGKGSLALGLGIQALAIGAAWQLLKPVTPLGDGGSMELNDSAISGFAKVSAMIALGTVAGAAGYGRINSGGNYLSGLPHVADALATIPRTAALRVIQDLAGDPAAEAVMSKLSTDPTYFSPEILRRLERPFKSGDVSLSGVIDDLMDNAEFRTKFEAIGK